MASVYHYYYYHYYTYQQHLVGSFNLLLTSKEDQYISEWLSNVYLQHRHYYSVDVVSLGSLRVVNVHGIATSRDPKDWCIVKELNTHSINQSINHHHHFSTTTTTTTTTTTVRLTRGSTYRVADKKVKHTCFT